MYAKRIIPCLDVKNGRVVKGVSFVNLRDAGDPVECAIAYDQKGADELVLLDITATHEGRGTMVEIVTRVANSIFIPFYLLYACCPTVQNEHVTKGISSVVKYIPFFLVG